MSKDGSSLKLSAGRYTLTESDGTVYTFTTVGLLETLTDAAGNTITLTYQSGKLSKLTDPAGNSLTLAYNAQGKIASVTSSRGDKVDYTYDATGKYLLSATLQDGRRITYTYGGEQSGRMAASGTLISYAPAPSGALGSIIYWDSDVQVGSLSLGYSPEGRFCGVSDNDGSTWTGYVCGNASWDGSAWKDTVNNPLVYHVFEGDMLVRTTYLNDMGSISRVEDAEGRFLLMNYNSKGQLVKISDQTGAYSTISYDKNGNAVKVTNPLGDTLQCFYDPKTNLPETLTDANGNTTSFTYLINGRITSITRADGTVERFWYLSTNFNQPASVVNRRGDSYAYTYDSSGIVLTNKPSTADKPIRYEYDSRDNLTKITDSDDGITLMEYNARDQLTKITYPGGRYLAYTYDFQGRRTSITDGGSYYVKYTYTDLGFLEKVLDGNNGDALITQYTYTSDGRFLRETQGNGTYTEYNYDQYGNLLTKKTCDVSDQELSRFDYTYDGRGLISTMTTLDGTWTYAYDAIGQLTASVYVASSGEVANQNLSWKYDAMGNRISSTENGTTTAYVGNNMNQYLSAGDYTYTYDADGNMQTKTNTQTGEVWTYTWCQGNWLREAVSSTGERWFYEYDAFGNLAATLHTKDGATERKEFLVDPSGLGDVVAEYDANGNLIVSYTYGYGLLSQIDAGGNASYYGFDHLGSTSVITDASGAVVNRYAYDPFGKSLLKQETIETLFQFVGEYGIITDWNTDMTRMRARWYAPQTGRFASEDPLGLNAGDANLYRYVSNSPTLLIDPQGLQECKPNGCGDENNQWVPDGWWIEACNEHDDCYCGNEGHENKSKLRCDSEFFMNLTIKTGGVPGVGISVPFGYTGAVVLFGREAFDAARGIPPYEWKPQYPGPGNAYPVPKPTPTPSPQQLLESYDTEDISNDSGEKTQYKENDIIMLAAAADRCEPEPPPGPPGLPVPPVMPEDPNEMLGPHGYGEKGYITVDKSLVYQINFENDADATAPAQRVDVESYLSDQLDWTTFELAGFGFDMVFVSIPQGAYHHEEIVSMETTTGMLIDVYFEAGIDLGTGRIFAAFQSIDPETELPLMDVLTGFLPPEDGMGSGMGFVSYIVKPKAGLQTEDRFNAVAKIQFDFGEIIDTNQIDPHDPSQGTDPAKECWLTIDADVPSSHVLPLPEQTNQNRFLVEWAGTDIGSGIAFYDVYVSIDGGAFEIWQKRTEETSAYFEGENGKTYSFISVATDNVGLVETTEKIAEAVTTLHVEPGGERVTKTVTMPNTVTANHWTVRKNGNNIEIVNAANSVVFTESITAFNHLVVNSSGATNDELIVSFATGGFDLEYGIEFNGGTSAEETLKLIGSDGDDVWQINVEARIYGGLPIFLNNVEYITIDGNGGHDQIWMDGTDGNDSFTFIDGIAEFTTTTTHFSTVNAEEVFVHAQDSNDMATVFSTDSNSTFSMSDNFFVMLGGGYRLELRSFNTIDAFATGRNDKTYVYGENDSLIVMGDQLVERRATGQAYRVWYSEQVTAINMDDSNNAILHTGSRGYDTYSVSQGYVMATNAVGSYYHEFVDFKNVNISTPMSTPTVSLPTATGWTKQEDRGVWTQNGFTVTVMGNANVTTRDKSPLPTQAMPMQSTAPLAETFAMETHDDCCGSSPNCAAVDPVSTTAMQLALLETNNEPPVEKRETALTHDRFDHVCWDDNLFAFLADEQLRLHRKKDKWFGDDDDAESWLAEFEKLALLELRK